ncbi:MAG: MBOAT family protein [Proteobacteria bacterium]|nr:MBOAT family protein [Pseudomonadota bacterium]
MLFSSWQFILLFLPVSVVIYHLLCRLQQPYVSRLWLVGASLFFYGYWDARYLALIVASILGNYGFGRLLNWIGGSGYSYASEPTALAKILLAVGIALNLIVLGYFKYAGFFMQNLNVVAGTSFPVTQIVLPLAISFFTFTQIVYLVDSYRKETGHYGLTNYSLFVLFFPHLIAGPIVQHSQIMPQFEAREARTFSYEYINLGALIFSIGLFKKLVLADTLAMWADSGFDGNGPISIYGAWAASLSYTFQLYFDFSGYCDMAIGASLFFNIVLPVNFYSPYKALNIQDFWRRWHITLSTFLRDYLYIPLGGSRGGEARTCINILITFLLGGLWHGATWMFVLWGAAHGIGLVTFRVWSKIGFKLPAFLAWGITFMFINLTWVLFRANTTDSALRIYSGMLNWRSAFSSDIRAIPVSDIAWTGKAGDYLSTILPINFIGQILPVVCILLAALVATAKNSIEISSQPIDLGKILGAALLFGFALQFALAGSSPVFLYFNF